MKHLLTIVTLILTFTSLYAQLYNALDTVIVEKYYISDANDAKGLQYIYDNETGNITDSIKLEEGSVTYRIFVQLASGCKLNKLYGDTSHTLRISSTAYFFNQSDYGQSFGINLKNNKLKYDLVALDTWLTLGMATSSNFGILKKDDNDGSVIGGTKNDSGYLVNADPAAGIPLTSEDGIYASKVAIPAGWLDFGILSGTDDSTIFGSLKVGKEFKSNNAFIKNNGVMGPDSNRVLIAQLTTKGDISFELNIQVIDTLNPSNPLYFVAKKSNQDLNDNIFVRSCLTYPPPPPICGCKDPKYVEYNPDYKCENNKDSCKTLKAIPKYGCMDPGACNYDTSANFNVKELCCYPGLCAGRDISIVCTDLGAKLPVVNIYPNPVSDKIKIEVLNFNTDKALLTIYNVYGNKIYENKVNTDLNITEVDVSTFVNGVYLLRVQNAEGFSITKHLIKN